MSSKLLSSRERSRFLRFCVVGVIGAVVDFGVSNLLIALLGFTLVAAGTISFIAAIHYTAAGYYEWYFPARNARVSVDGKASGAFLHRERLGGSVILTRTDLPTRVSYRVFFGTGLKPKPGISGCGEWHPYRYAIVFRGDVNPPCFIVAAGESTEDKSQPEALAIGPKFLEFIAPDGKRVRAEW